MRDNLESVQILIRLKCLEIQVTVATYSYFQHERGDNATMMTVLHKKSDEWLLQKILVCYLTY